MKAVEEQSQFKKAVSEVRQLRKKKWSPSQKKEAMWGLLFVSPFIIGFLGFMFLPMMFSFIGSFTNYNITSRMDFIGLTNFRRMFTQDELFTTSLYNTAYYVIFNVPLTAIGSVFLAVLLNRQIRGIRLFRTIFYLPAVLSGVAVYVLWMQLLSPSTGLINTILSWVGISGPSWLFDPQWTKPALIIMRLWSVGGAMLLYLATLQNVPKQLYESAEVDGAGFTRQFFHITLPMITPIIFYDVVTSTIGAFQIFQEAYVMTEGGTGGPANSLLFYNLHMWNQAFVAYNMGYAMAMSMILFLIVLTLTFINLKLAPRWVHY
ncbi:spermidine/putrescine ABC transporter permease [Alkalibacterium pelagium]|uniref:Multiple sugar transport system permease protein n=2 Tax=Alkalibacterium pelagium TaxID=426702 RepID=A0A1H7HGK2_9LACT|nr:spermidine/putrescine ABC transporter permease [Alkalibacterium pelagium]SEK49526.1 multiple sugar transport system permease protein [Alkalibacterium pelagium]